MVDTLVMIIYSYGEQFLGPVLPDYILVEKRLDLGRLAQFLDATRGLLLLELPRYRIQI